MRILIVEDDQAAAKNICKGLREKGFEVTAAEDGKQGLDLARQQDYSVLIVDRMLPKLDGLALIRTLRSEGNNTPALMLTALDEIDNTVEGLEAGADDYMGKPFNFAELLARVNALSRRHSATNSVQSVITIGDLTVDKINRVAKREGKVLHLQPKEFDVLAFMAVNQGEVITRAMLLEHIWNVEFDPQTNIVDVHISRLRQKVDKGYRDPIIMTVRGIGYTIEK